MKRIAWMFVVVLGSVSLMQAQNASEAMQNPENSMKLSGTVCSASCVTQVGSSMTPTCDTSCTSKDNPVLVDDAGNVHKISNQDMCKKHMGKHVKMTAAKTPPTEKQREETLRVMELYDDPGGGL